MEVGAGQLSILGRIPLARAAAASARRALMHQRVAREYREFAGRAAIERPDLPVKDEERFFCLDNRTATTPFDSHYVYHTAWATRGLAARRPAQHVDIASSVYFVALASAIVPVEHLDYRPPALVLPNVTCRGGDITALPYADDSVHSLSCMHVIEHIGLGRYGDPIDPRGDVAAAAELARILAPGGWFYFVVPVGRPRVCFNAHRVYDVPAVQRLFPGLTIRESALVPDDASRGLIENPSSALVAQQQYGCGCFAMQKAS